MLRPIRTALRSSHLARRTYTSSSLAEIKRKWNDKLVFSEEVEHALQTRSPVIALETAIVTHGMPHPTNYDTALSVETIIRSGKVTPATIVLIDGRIHVGLTDALLQQISDPGWKSVKVSRRDLAPVLSQKGNGGTTVAGTMYIAQSVGIPLFVTGGIGGVHRGAESSMDVSADLIELGRTPMGVVCAGAKSILDIPRTLEVLETQGVCVASYAQKEFPAFYTPSSGLYSPWSVPDASAAANLIHTGLKMPNPLATLLAVPPPPSETGDKVQAAVEQAVKESVEQGIDKRGKEATPWLLKRVGELTGGSALNLNIKLIENNARVGTEVAREMAKLQSDAGSGSGFGSESESKHASMSAYMPVQTSDTKAQMKSTSASSSGSTATGIGSGSGSEVGQEYITRTPVVVQVFGSAAIDITTRPSIQLQPGTTTPGTIQLTPGGVGRNIAEAAQNLMGSGAVQLVSTIGSVGTSRDHPSPSPSPSTSPSPETSVTDMTRSNDTDVDGFGKVLMLEMQSAGLRTDGLQVKVGERTAGCTLSLGLDGDLSDGVADMSIIESLSPELVDQRIRDRRPQMVVFDCNLTTPCISQILATASELDIPTFCDPTSTPKLPRLLASLPPTRSLTHYSPNLLELQLTHTLLSSDTASDPDSNQDIAWGYINSLNLTNTFRAKLEAWTRNSNPNTESERGWIAEKGVIQQAIGLMPYVRELWIKCGSKGLIHVGILPVPSPGYARNGGMVHALPGDMGHLVVRHYEALEIRGEEVVSTTGAGDTLVGGLVAGLLSGEEEEVWVGRALEQVGRTMRSHRAVG